MKIMSVYDKVACTEPGCSFVAEVNEKIGTTCGYFKHCPECGSKGSLNKWSVAKVWHPGMEKILEKQYVDGEVKL